MKYDCKLIQDIIPLYIDNILSDKSKEIVEKHLVECDECKEYFEISKAELLKKQEQSIEYKSQTVKYAKKINRTRMIIATSTIIVFVITIGFFLNILRGKYDYFEVNLTNYTEAVEYIERGWLPEELPKNVSNIYITYNIDNNQVNGRFHIPTERIDEFKSLYELADVNDLRETHEALNYTFKNIKNKLEKGPEDVVFLKDDLNIYVLSSDGTVYFFSLIVK